VSVATAVTTKRLRGNQILGYGGDGGDDEE
jgi:hypothetical protein